jgi:hypothetical protein
MMQKARRLFIDLIFNGLIGAILGSLMGAINFGIAFFMPWLSERQREAIFPVSVIIGLLLGMANVFVSRRQQGEKGSERE